MVEFLFNLKKGFWVIWGCAFFIICGCSYERRRRRRLRAQQFISANAYEVRPNYPVIVTPNTPYNFTPFQANNYGATNQNIEPPAYSTLEHKPYQNTNFAQ